MRCGASPSLGAMRAPGVEILCAAPPSPIAGGMVMGAPLVPPVSRITQIMTASVPHDSARRVPSCCPGPWCMRCDAVDGICLTASLPRGREFGIENGELEM